MTYDIQFRVNGGLWICDPCNTAPNDTGLEIKCCKPGMYQTLMKSEYDFIVIHDAWIDYGNCDSMWEESKESVCIDSTFVGVFDYEMFPVDITQLANFIHEGQSMNNVYRKDNSEDSMGTMITIASGCFRLYLLHNPEISEIIGVRISL